MQSAVLDKAMADVKVWRNGYATLVTAITAIMALIGTQLTSSVGAGWRLVLTLALGAGVVLVGRALTLTLRIEGGKAATTVNLQQIVQEYNSVEMYRAQQAATALEQLDRSKKWAGWGALFCLIGLICTLWMTSTPGSDKGPKPSPSGSASVPAVKTVPTP